MTTPLTLVAASFATLAVAQPFPFGNATSDTFTGPNDEAFSVPVTLPQPLPLEQGSIVRVEQHVNGYVRLSQNDSQLPDALLDAYYMDLDTSNGGADQNELWLRAGNATDDLRLARDIIAGNGTIFNPQSIIVATWNKIEACCNRPSQKNTFQLALPYSDTNETWAILAYPQLQYFQSDGFNMDFASAGFSDINSTEQQPFAYVNSTESMNMLANGTNCNRTGVYAFRIRQGGPTKAPTHVPTNTPSTTPTQFPRKVPTNTPVRIPPTVAPMVESSLSCGLLGWSLFCPFTLCGIFGRLLGWCREMA